MQSDGKNVFFPNWITRKKENCIRFAFIWAIINNNSTNGICLFVFLRCEWSVRTQYLLEINWTKINHKKDIFSWNVYRRIELHIGWARFPPSTAQTKRFQTAKRESKTATRPEKEEQRLVQLKVDIVRLSRQQWMEFGRRMFCDTRRSHSTADACVGPRASSLQLELCAAPVTTLGVISV